MRRLATPFLVGIGLLLFLLHTFYELSKAGTVPVIIPEIVDLYDYFLPYLTFAKETVLSGSLPLWNPFQGIGTPFFAAIQAGLLYPLNWVILLLEVPQAMLVVQASAISIAMIGMALYLRYLGVRWPGVVLAMALFGRSASAHVCHLSIGSTYCWLPIVFLLSHRLIDRPSLRRCALLALSLSLCFFAGNTQYFYYIVLVVSIYMLFLVFYYRHRGWQGSVMHILGLIALTYLLTAGLISAQLFPTLELSLASIRNAAGQLAAGDPFVHEFSIVSMVLDYLNRTEGMYYFGSSLLFIPFAFGSRQRRPAVLALLASLGYAFMFILSKQMPDLGIFDRLPFSQSFRWTVRMMLVSNFMLAALAGIGLSDLWENIPFQLWNRSARRVSWFWLVIVSAAAILLYEVYSLGFTRADHSLFYPVILSISLVVVLVLVLSAHKLSPRAKTLTLCALALLSAGDAMMHKELAVTFPGMTKTKNTAALNRQVNWIRDNAGLERVLFIPRGLGFYHPNVGAMYRFYSINSYETFTLARWHNYVRFMMGPREFDVLTRVSTFYGVIASPITEIFLREARLAGLASLRYFITSDKNEVQLAERYGYAWRKVDKGSGSTERYTVYENRFALPRAYLVNKYVITEDEEESLEAIKGNISRLSSSVILENGRPSFPSVETSSTAGRVEVREFGINEVILEIKAETPAIVVLTDSYYPGWKAFVDGMRKPIWRANSLFRAVEVPPGEHILVFRYQPASLYWGFLVSTIVLALTLAGLLIGNHLIKAGSRV
ncbi:MAG: hypothetical protein C4532_14275 [Candidatus Abyssobacteria bacterium SURF_17]|uniref:YfhO family protein n=1 Tax=Candidatus Abyssobacteria bacterium SURF_17 TaxID=2093361 RepID=A0A419EU73_9BACT|nr:MAG: hypothetical protein C4532_14275 [Candidatus Abyssubacteria bacterium SURF_17]